ncbi:DUF6520 family protein [Pedobacter namyangjuensis]|uniref:DUF6520 family protein n=1 Tax=Pedobacter namyangjuensis TaxID=600626 RepID=UPI000DE39CC2|nr:DUF6520 family protein [Pedobacter namyangjuensis]
MKNLKKILAGLLALIVVCGIVFTTSAFKNDKKVTTLKYRFIGSSDADLDDPTKWQDVSSQPNPESCNPGTELPCLVVFQDNEYDDIADFYNTHTTSADMFTTSKVISRKD